MKKLIILWISILLLCTACQKTPESPIVVGKNTENMLAAADAMPDNSAQGVSIRERYAIPTRLNYAEETADRKLAVQVSASVDVPETTELPIVRVKPRDFTQAEATRYFNAFCSGVEMFEEDRRQTKAQIEETILYYRQLIADPTLRREKLYEDDDIEMLQEQITQLEQDYQNAPEVLEAVRADDTIKKMERMENGKLLYSYTGIHAYSSGFEQSFQLDNNNDLNKPVVLSVDGQSSSVIPVLKGARLNYSNNPAIYGLNQDDSEAFPVEDMQTVPDRAAGKLRVTPMEALMFAQEQLSKTDMVVTNLCLISNRGVMERFGKEEAFAYRIQCGRNVAGAILPGLSGMATPAIVNGNAPGATPPPEDSFTRSWSYECLSIVINDEGIIYFSWDSPCEIMETVNANSYILPFTDIADIFKKMIIVTHEYESKLDNVRKLTLNIDIVSLELMRVLEQNSLESGLLIPVWNFYGIRMLDYADGMSYNSAKSILLSINAIDGSIIDISKGY